jgi:outer membrane protein assembly factor BamA
LSADIYAPDNTHNFFGTGNETEFNKTGDYVTFYRSRYSFYQFAAGLRWKLGTGITLSAGPAVQHYTYDSADNHGRFLENGNTITTYDSATLSEKKTHAGIFMNLIVNKRNNPILPTKGYLLTVKLQALAGASSFAKSYAQLIPEFSVYKALNEKRSVIIADRVGGAISMGKIAFYQSVFEGGHENLLGYRQYRFAGEHSLYNNLEARIRLARFAGYIIPGDFGMIAFYDLGRVWTKDEESHTWHQGIGGGLYFAPARMAVLNVLAGYSQEGWYPYITLGVRF